MLIGIMPQFNMSTSVEAAIVVLDTITIIRTSGDNIGESDHVYTAARSNTVVREAVHYETIAHAHMSVIFYCLFAIFLMALFPLCHISYALNLSCTEGFSVSVTS